MTIVKVKPKTVPLNVSEKEELRKNEEIIDRNQKAFLEVGEALMRISEGRLYRVTHKTFEAYVLDRWDFTGRQAYYLMGGAAVVQNLNKSSEIVVRPTYEAQVRPLIGLAQDQQEEVWKKAVEDASDGEATSRVKVTARVVAEAKKEVLNEDYEPSDQSQKTRFNRTSARIDWAKWSWNPLTGCKHGCRYCYARDTAELHKATYPNGFKPHWRPERLGAPGTTTIPEGDRNQPGIRNVFVCSMGDLFGDWVKQSWIDAVMKAVRTHKQWTYLFLTKNPKRLVGIDWPDNAWVGATVDLQKRVKPTIAAMEKVKAKVRFISCEPLLEAINFPTLECIDWLIIGPQSKGGAVRQPERQWVTDLMKQAWDAGKKVYCKPDLRVAVREYPED